MRKAILTKSQVLGIILVRANARAILASDRHAGRRNGLLI